MKTILWSLVAVVVGLGGGALVGQLTHPRAEVPAAAVQAPGVEPEPPQGQALPLFADPTATAVAVPGPAAAAPLAKPTEAAAAAAAAAAPTAILVIPHGPGRFATLDLQAAELSQLSVYQGTLARDGLANLAAISRAAKIATLRGPEPKVELLHLGFDRQAQPVAAHVRLTDGPAAGQEGMVLLRVPRKELPDAAVAVLPIASEPAEPEPAGAEPQP